MEVRMHIEQMELRRIFEKLQSRGYSKEKISKAINYRFDSALYYGYTIPQSSFEKLRELVNEEILAKVIYKNQKITIEKSETTAEMVGILLGDGYIGYNPEHKHYQIIVSLNSVEETDYINYVAMMMERIFQKEVSRYFKKGKALDLVLYGKSIVEAIMSLGLRSGNKTKNQVGVPDWIKENQSFTINCLRGLSDTDGSFYGTKYQGHSYIRFNFTNSSNALLYDFKSMCESIGVLPSKISNRRVQIQSQNEVKKLINIINSFQWNMKKSHLLSYANNEMWRGC